MEEINIGHDDGNRSNRDTDGGIEECKESASNDEEEEGNDELDKRRVEGFKLIGGRIV